METSLELSPTSEPIFSTDWFSPVVSLWEEVLAKYKGQPGVRVLEIGSYEGRSARWLLENILTHESARIDCLDIFKDEIKDEAEAETSSPILQRFLHNIAPYAEKVSWVQGKSQLILRGEAFDPSKARKYDFIYIDGSHEARDVLEDAMLAYRLLKIGGILIFDDFEFVAWSESYRNPKTAILAFFGVFKQQFKLLHKGRQFVLERIGE